VAGHSLADPRPHIPDPDHEQARHHPDQDTLEMATAGAAKVLGTDHGATRAFAKAAAAAS